MDNEGSAVGNTTFNNKRNHTLVQAGVINGPINITTEVGETRAKRLKVSYDVSLNLPFPRNRNFTGRKTELENIEKYFSESSSSSSASVFAITGTGGMGKTQIALEYAYSCHEKRRFTAVFWVSTATEGAIRTSFVNIMQQIFEEQVRASWPDPPDYETIGASLGIANLVDRSGKIKPDPDPEALNNIKSALFSWLKIPDNRKWLLVFDNADDLSFDIEKYFPSHGGCILVTSRRPEFFHFAEQANLDGLDRESAVTLLSRLARLRNPTESVIQDVVKVVEELGFLPLAITHAGCFIYEMNIPVRDYRQHYERAFKEAQSQIPKVGWAYREDTAVTTWEISFLEIQKQDEEAALILLVCGYLLPENILEDWWEVEGGNPDLDFRIQQKKRFSLLASYSLINRDQPGKFSIHPVVHNWARERGGASSRLRVMVGVVELLSNKVKKYSVSLASDPDRSGEDMPAYERYMVPKMAAFIAPCWYIYMEMDLRGYVTDSSCQTQEFLEFFERYKEFMSSFIRLQKSLHIYVGFAPPTKRI
ncbi:hypothetical protein TWF718_004995 [Orbilia javanica]|uniref:Orc1-like AAA ATPase domain-containing protein n=1 Tax=Orbilia javanica TaxID=47235 RepID=A0AAN8RFE9_9PEZI